MYADALTENIEIQYESITDAGAGSWTESWVTARRIPCSISTMSSREKLTYKRQGHEHVMVVLAENPIPRTQTTNSAAWTSLFDLFNDPDSDRIRLLYQGRRTLTIIGFDRTDDDSGSPFGDMVKIIAIETPRRVGPIDA